MEPRFCFTLDVEPDDLWAQKPDVSFEHFSRLYEFHEGLSTRGCRPTYLTTSEIVEDSAARRVMGQIMDTGTAEVGAHFHTWTRSWPFEVPDLGSPAIPALAAQLGQKVEEQMLAYTCEAIRTHLGVSPVSHRGGRWSLNGDSVRSLENCGILVDSSVAPGREWFDDAHVFLDGPDYRQSSQHPHYLRAGSLEPYESGPILELPVGASFRPNRSLALSSSFPVRAVRKVAKLFGRHMGYLWLRPALLTSEQLRTCLQDLKSGDVSVWVVMIHSSEIAANPYFSSEAGIQAFIQRCYSVVEDAIELGAIPSTMKEVWEHFDANPTQVVCGGDGRGRVGGHNDRLSA